MNSKKNPILKSSKVRVGLTIGDPSGIGPAITLKAIKKLQSLADFTIIGDRWLLNRLKTYDLRHKTVRIVDLKNVPRKNFSFGKIKAAYGKASIEYLDKALELIKQKEIDCLVTAPISKESINLAGFKYSGHTEYLADKTNTKDFAMMLLNSKIKFSLITRHLPLKNVSSSLDQKSIYKTILLTHEFLKKNFALKNPRIVFCGLNPHASDNGLIGREEISIISPVIRKIKNKFKFNIAGPISADVAIYKARDKIYDCVIAVYHDQALIPLKLLDNRGGVNITLGLPFIRTSVLHGTAFDIAKNTHLIKADSLIEAVRFAVKCIKNQRKD
ncbi:MAG: 4-hydroxythreonine-4-phosphate dehydrogenase PdxA [Candidatus Omnitrophota bacterium]